MKIKFVGNFALDVSFTQITEWAQRKSEGYEFQNISVEILDNDRVDT